MSPSRRRRDPDPSKPGTVYRSRPSLRRTRHLGDGPPYLNDRDPRSSAGSAGSAGRAPAGLGTVDEIYAQNGGDYQAGSEYGNRFDSAREVRTPPGGQYADPYAGYGPDGRGRGPDPGRPPAPAPARRRRRPPIRLIVGLIVLLVIGYPILLGFTAYSSLNRIDALAPAHAKLDTAGSPGRTYLVVGSDSRTSLSAAERKRLGTGSGNYGPARTDTIMMLHVPSGGGATTLISLPRDSYVPIPGHGKNKINAAFAFGGAPLLIQTVESVTGVRIDDYVETGLDGFATVVDALGGVTLCPKFAMDDKDAHINLKKGCQSMDGRTALGYARARHSDPRGDLGRVERQRETLAAISKKTLSPSTLIQPWRAFPAAKAGGGALTVDVGTSVFGVAKFVLAMRAVSGGGGISMTVPIGNPNAMVGRTSVVLWDTSQATKLFSAIKTNDMDAVAAIAAAQKKSAS